MMDTEQSQVELGIDGISQARRIGEGGFGVVYRARQEDFGRTVAVKVLRAMAMDGESRRRFESECRAVGSLSGHPHIVALYASGMAAGGQSYLVMEHLPGGTLAERLARGPMDPDEVAAIGVKLAGALAAAHAAGVLHRDIKPENVLVSAYGEPQLVDFGVARVQGGTATRSGLITGSLGHAAPEVLSGVRATETSDVYSLASTLYALSAGQAPFVREGEESFHPQLARILTEEAPDLRSRGVPGPLWEALAAALEKDPAARTPSATAFAEAVQAAQEAAGGRPTPLVALPASAPDDTLTRLRPDPGTVTLSGVARRPRPDPPTPPGHRAGTWVTAGPNRRLGIVAVVVVLALVAAGTAGAMTFGRSSNPTAPGSSSSMSTAVSDAATTLAPESATTLVPPTSTPDSSVPAAPTSVASTTVAPGKGDSPADPARLGPSSGPDTTTIPHTPVPILPDQPTTAPAPVPGQWTAVPAGLGGHCSNTQQSGPNLWYQICWSGATPMVLVTVSGITGKSPNHALKVPRVWTVVNGVQSRGTTCPLKTVTIGQHFACIDETGPSSPGMNVVSWGRLQDGGVEITIYTPRI